MLTVVAIWNHYEFDRNKTLFSFLYILDLALIFVLAGFNGWNWYLAISGYTIIEFWSTDSKKEQAPTAFKSVSDNLYRVFGTHKLMRIFSPSLRNVPFTGLEWSFYWTDLGFD